MIYFVQHFILHFSFLKYLFNQFIRLNFWKFFPIIFHFQNHFFNFINSFEFKYYFFTLWNLYIITLPIFIAIALLFLLIILFACFLIEFFNLFFLIKKLFQISFHYDYYFKNHLSCFIKHNLIEKHQYYFLHFLDDFTSFNYLVVNSKNTKLRT